MILLFFWRSEWIMDWFIFTCLVLFWINVRIYFKFMVLLFCHLHHLIEWSEFVGFFVALGLDFRRGIILRALVYSRNSLVRIYLWLGFVVVRILAISVTSLITETSLISSISPLISTETLPSWKSLIPSISRMTWSLATWTKGKIIATLPSVAALPSHFVGHFVSKFLFHI